VSVRPLWGFSGSLLTGIKLCFGEDASGEAVAAGSIEMKYMVSSLIPTFVHMDSLASFFALGLGTCCFKASRKSIALSHWPCHQTLIFEIGIR